MGRPKRNLEPDYVQAARALYLAVPEQNRLCKSYDDLTPQAKATWREIARHHLACGEMPDLEIVGERYAAG